MNEKFLLTLLLIFALVGLAAGLVAGLFGLGGGVVIVPALIYTFAVLDFPREIATHLAVGTSLTCILVTASVSSWTHWQKQAIDFRLLKPLVPGVLLGALLGGEIASRMAGSELQLAFGVFLAVVAVTMLWKVQDALFPTPRSAGLGLAGVVIGTVSALFGVGGGSMTVPYLRLCGVAMARAVATSAALGLPIAFSGSLSYAWQGWSHDQLPTGSLGFIYLPAFVGLVVCSAPASRVGAKLAHRLPAQRLQQAFAVVLMLIAAELIGSVIMATA